MKSRTYLAVAAFAGIANAQSACLASAQTLPACALGYIASYAFSSKGCGLADFGCQCSNLEDIANTVVPIIGNGPQPCDPAALFTSATNFCSCVTSNEAAGPVTLDPVESACQASAAAIPPCALGFLAESAYSIATCNIQDFECQCSNFNAIEGAVAGSIVNYCSGTDINVILSSATALCQCVTSAAGAGVSPTSPGSSPATTTPAVPITSGSASPSSSGVSVAAPTSAGSSGSSKVSGASSAKPTTTGAGTGSGTGSGSGSGSGSSSGKAGAIPTFTGAGATMSAFGGLFGVVAGLAAFL